MARTNISDTSLLDHVKKMGDEHPPLTMDQIDFTVHNRDAIVDRFGVMLDYLARVELEVERNVKELDRILPHPSEPDRMFYQDIWAPQEIMHGHILDKLKIELGLPHAEPLVDVGFPVKVLGALSHLPGIQDVSRTVYYFTGASTERQAVLAYSKMMDELDGMGESDLKNGLVHPIKQQEPGHFAFYSMSATKAVAELKPWQLQLARRLRAYSYELVGTHSDPVHQAEMGVVAETLGFTDVSHYAKEIGRLEARVLWDNQNGMDYPPYVLRALEESARLAREGVHLAA